MLYKLNDPKVIQAIDLVVRDTDKKYDECLVEKFQDYIRYRINNMADKQEIEDVLNRIHQYMGHKAFIMMNQTRAIKILTTTLNGRFDLVSLTKTWDILDTIVINNDLSALTVVLKLFNSIISCDSDKPTYWLLNQRFVPPISFATQEPVKKTIQDSLSLIEDIVANCINYHTKNQATDLLVTLINNLYFKFSSSSELQLHKNCIKKTFCNLVASFPRSVEYIIAKISKLLDSERPDHEELRQELCELLWKRVKHEFNQKKGRIEYISCLKSLALLTPLQVETETITRLQEVKSITGVIVYLTHLRHVQGEHPLFVTYVVYPLLVRCKIEEEERKTIEESLTKRMPDVIEREYVQVNVTDEAIRTCIACLTIVLSSKDFTSLSLSTLQLISSVLTYYVRCNHASFENYTNVMGCCKALRVLEELLSGRFGVEELADTSLKVTSDLSKIIETFNDVTYQNKPILIELFSLLRRSLGGISSSSHEEKKSHIVHYVKNSVKYAMQINDPDVLSEFAELLNSVGLDCGKQIVELVCDHMYPRAVECEHRDLMSKVVVLLTRIADSIKSTPPKSETASDLVKIQSLIELYQNSEENDNYYLEEDENATDKVSNEPHLSSFVDDILNFELLSDGILDCY